MYIQSRGKAGLITENAASGKHSSESFVVAVSVVTANDAVLLVVVLQSIPKHFDLEPSPATAVTELGATATARHVIAAGRSLDVNLQQQHRLTTGK